MLNSGKSSQFQTRNLEQLSKNIRPKKINWKVIDTEKIRHQSFNLSSLKLVVSKKGQRNSFLHKSGLL